MPIKLPDALPAVEVLRRENIFVMEASHAEHQDIRALRILILNLMPKKIETEIHLLRMLSNTPLQVDVELMRIEDRPSSNTPIEHMDAYYKHFDEVRDSKYDGFIITGAPLGQLPFDEVRFWEPLSRIMDWSVQHTTSTMFLCWAVQAAMFHLYGIQKQVLKKKLSGVYEHRLEAPLAPIARGFDDIFFAPHSRYGEILASDMAARPELEIVAASQVAGPYIIARRDGSQLFVVGHSEYEPHSLKDEYERDLAAGLNPAVPENYFPDDNPELTPIVTWKSHGNLLFSNWLNYYVYQLTPYSATEIGRLRKKHRTA